MFKQLIGWRAMALKAERLVKRRPRYKKELLIRTGSWDRAKNNLTPRRFHARPYPPPYGFYEHPAWPWQSTRSIALYVSLIADFAGFTQWQTRQAAG